MPHPEPRVPRALLCDADGNLFPSEEPAFDASASVTNALLARLGSTRRWEPDELRRVALGRNFRTLATDLLAEHGAAMSDAELEDWVGKEQRAVVELLGRVLRPDERVRRPLQRLAAGHLLAVVSSSALARLDVCLTATGLDALFPADLRVSAQDSLPRPTSKPDPAVYRAALELLEIGPGDALAVEDATSGVRSAVGAGIEVVGNLVFTPPAERVERGRELRAAGASAVVEDWEQLEDLLAGRRPADVGV